MKNNLEHKGSRPANSQQERNRESKSMLIKLPTEKTVNEVAAALQAAGKSIKPFELLLGGIGTFLPGTAVVFLDGRRVERRLIS